MSAPEFTRHDPDGRANGLILMLHGGTQDSHSMVDEKSLSWRRSAWMQREIAPRAIEQGIGVWLLRYKLRGWNAHSGSIPAPVTDARWALAQVRRELGAVPVVLLGHSMGARTSVAVADDPQVTGVVALAPWFPAGEPIRALSSKHLAAAQGRRDKITSYKATRAFLQRAADLTVSTEFEDMGRVGHYMFRRRKAWNEFAITRSLSLLQQRVTD